MKLAILAPFPPPYGGVSVHALRLAEALGDASDDVAIVDVGRPSPWMFMRVLSLIWRRDRVVHYHSDEGNWKTAVLFGLLFDLMGTCFVITLHSFRERSAFRNVLVRTLLQSAYEQASCVICISEHVREEVVQRIGVRESHCDVISSTLPISRAERATPLPPSIPASWLQAPERVLFNVSRLVRYEGRDLYGLDVILEAWKTVAQECPTARLLVVIATVVDPTLLREAEARCADMTSVEMMTNYTGPLLPITAASHVVVRATRTEGGPSLTVQEALELGCIAVASDAVPRPPGTVLFTNEDPTSCAQALVAAVHRAAHMQEHRAIRRSSGIVEMLRARYRMCITT